ncbi:MAG: amidohydrolase family protein [Myxococcales bacterium]|nr:amidohydrolase family protein [Myxococcales bacterium]
MNVYVPTNLYDGEQAVSHEGYALVEEGGRIVAVGPESDVVPKAGNSTRFRLDGTLMPGLIDCHTHVSLSGGSNPVADLKADSPTRRVVRALAALAAQRRAGVTTIRDVGGPGGLDLELARGIREGWVVGPRMLAAGEVICITGGHACFLGIEADGADAVRRAVRSQIKAGADLVKVIATGGVITPGVEPGAAQMTPEELSAACTEAKKAGRLVAAHAQGAQGIRDALLAGVHTIEHGFYLDTETIGLMVARGAVLVPTFAAAEAMLDGEGRGVPQYMLDKIRRISGAHVKSFRAALAAGVEVACGTDAGTPLNPHGRLSREAALFVAHGASPAQACRGCTGAAARAIGRDDVGVLQVGRRADLLLIAGNPLDDVEALSRVRAVFMDGLQVEGEVCRSD